MAQYHELLADALASKFAAEGMDPDIAPTAAGLVASRARLDAEGRNTVPVSDLIEAVRAEHPAMFRAFAKPAETTAPDKRTPLQRDSDNARAAAATQRANRVRELTTMGNPWAPATRNLTRQSIVTNLDPALAARLQAEART